MSRRVGNGWSAQGANLHRGAAPPNAGVALDRARAERNLTVSLRTLAVDRPTTDTPANEVLPGQARLPVIRCGRAFRASLLQKAWSPLR
jgi:hypothetical protein